jgi:hypothetical protein
LPVVAPTLLILLKTSTEGLHCGNAEANERFADRPSGQLQVVRGEARPAWRWASATRSPAPWPGLRYLLDCAREELHLLHVR